MAEGLTSDLLLSLAASYPGPVAIDTETSSKRWWVAELGVVSFAWGPNEGESFATRNVDAAIRAINYRMSCGLPCVFHNSGYDLHVLARHGLRINHRVVDDTLLLARLVNNLGQNDLKALGKQRLGYEPAERDEVKAWIRSHSTKKSGWPEEHGRLPNYLDVPDDVLLPYATQDARLTAMLYPLLKAQANAALYEREKELRRLMFEAEEFGVLVDPEMVQSRMEQALREKWIIDEKLQALRGAPINLDSDPQLRGWLYDDLGLKPVSETPGGQPQVNEFSLTSNPHPVTRLVLARNKRSKSAEFFQSYLELRDDADRIHPTINTMQARTHRFSCSDPNMQQIPSRNDRFKTRECFTAGSGWFIGADYDKQELRIAAEEAGDAALLSDLTSGIDVYVAMARAMLRKQDISGSERQAAKVAVLSMIYGAGAPKVAESFTVNTGRPYTVDQAKEIRSNFKEAYPGLNRLMNDMQDEARSRGRVVNRWGRELYVQPERAYVATDYLVQSSGRDVLADAILNTAPEIAKYGGRVVLPIHDELILFFPEEPGSEVMQLVAATMRNDKFSVPLTVSPKKGSRLSDLK